jgi:hypothetical protein
VNVRPGGHLEADPRRLVCVRDRARGGPHPSLAALVTPSLYRNPKGGLAAALSAREPWPAVNFGALVPRGVTKAPKFASRPPGDDYRRTTMQRALHHTEHQPRQILRRWRQSRIDTGKPEQLITLRTRKHTDHAGSPHPRTTPDARSHMIITKRPPNARPAAAISRKSPAQEIHLIHLSTNPRQIYTNRA